METPVRYKPSLEELMADYRVVFTKMVIFTEPLITPEKNLVLPYGFIPLG